MIVEGAFIRKYSHGITYSVQNMATKRHSQPSLLDMFSSASAKRPALQDSQHSEELSGDEEDPNSSMTDTYHDLASVSGLSSSAESSGTSTSQCSESVCSSFCCSDLMKPFQPATEGLACLTSNGRKFVPKWFQHYPRLTVCSTIRKVFCYECRCISKRELLTFSRNGSPAFTSNGFNNWKKGVQKFNSHKTSHAHREAHMKMVTLSQPVLPERFRAQIRCAQEGRRKALLIQLSCLRYLLRQGLALRGHMITHREI